MELVAEKISTHLIIKFQIIKMKIKYTIHKETKSKGIMR